MRVVIHIEIGNEAMETWSDVREALRTTASKFATRFGDAPKDGEYMRIKDVNGNSVGEILVDLSTDTKED